MPSSCVCVCVCRVVVWQSLSKPCDSSAECASGSECVSLFDEPAFMSLLHSVKLTGDDDGSDLETCGGGAGLQKDVSGPQMQCDGDVGAQQSVQLGRDSLVLGCVLCVVGTREQWHHGAVGRTVWSVRLYAPSVSWDAQ